jgi:hypothetical protein
LSASGGVSGLGSAAGASNRAARSVAELMECSLGAWGRGVGLCGVSASPEARLNIVQFDKDGVHHRLHPLAPRIGVAVGVLRECKPRNGLARKKERSDNPLDLGGARQCDGPRLPAYCQSQGEWDGCAAGPRRAGPTGCRAPRPAGGPRPTNPRHPRKLASCRTRCLGPGGAPVPASRHG